MGQLRKIRILVRNPQHEARDGQREHDNGDFEHGGISLAGYRARLGARQPLALAVFQSPQGLKFLHVEPHPLCRLAEAGLFIRP
jgi:hypothetical protein